ncbi:mannan endo-1,4-beta-mannosidase 6 [Impatiens glandulifera]|uniref:mannan endo-1,4-beta-mannosidase 6 n=1 Tax=Impatiens glandulifera TaxID=253017 RepID=UPI001FB0940E|nr:mannan endo-1,4-beta-mannosidase 6 [Impatiens glandulifera]
MFGLKIVILLIVVVVWTERVTSTYSGIGGVKAMGEQQMENEISYIHSQAAGTFEEEEQKIGDGGGSWTMVQRKGKQFVLNGGGQPFYINGFNTYWLMVFAADLSTRGKISETFQQASSLGLTVCRTWAFNDGQWRALQKSPSVYDEQVFQALDFVVNEAKKYKIRLILSLVNNWEAYGGKAQYVKWGREIGGLNNLTSDDDFFSHPTLKAYYKSHVKTVLNRVNSVNNITYKDDPTIFAWELMNEARCTSDPSGDKLQAWIEEMAVYVKSIDPKHLVEIGVEGFYGLTNPNRADQVNPNAYAKQVGTDFIRNHQVLGIDFASVHIYSDSWISQSISDEHLRFVKSWMQSHIEDAENLLGGMPVVFSEFGISRKDVGYNSSFRDTFLSTVYKNILDSAKAGGPGAGALLWQLFPEGTDYMDDGYAIIPSASQSVSNVISLHSTKLNTFNSFCSWKCHWGCRKKKNNNNFMPFPNNIAVDEHEF